MLTPIEEAIAQNPTPAVLHVGPGGAYSSSDDFVPGASAPHPVVGTFSAGTAEGLATDYSGLFTIKGADMPDGLSAEQSRCVVGETSYTIMQIRTRRWEGKIDGYTLKLA